MFRLPTLVVLLFLAGCLPAGDDAAPEPGQLVPDRLFLQQVAYDSALLKWRGEADQVYVGLSADTMIRKAVAYVDGDHKIARFTDLEPDTRYYYGFSRSGRDAVAGSFLTAPLPGEAPADGNIRLLLLGDSGTESEQSWGRFPHKGEARAVKDGYLRYNQEHGGNEPVDLLLLLGDNAYLEGTDDQWQTAFFDIYPDIIRSAATWPTIGNHEMGVGDPIDVCVYRRVPACDQGPVMLTLGGVSESADPNSYDSDGNGPDPSGMPYLNIFTLPTDGELGGVGSGTEQYYSFNYGNVHVVSLDSQLSNRDASQRQRMRQWLIDDLAQNRMDWTIVIFHHPPYSKGENHDSDHEQNEIDMRETFVPVFENYGVDAVFSGHSHSYERSWYLRGHYGASVEFDLSSHAYLVARQSPVFGHLDHPYPHLTGPETGRTVYTVAGSGGKADELHPCNGGQTMGCTLPDWLMHPAHRTFDEGLPDHRRHGIARKGVVVLDITASTLTSRFVDVDGNILDEFAIIRTSR